QVFGGVSPELLWGGFVVTFLTMFSVAGISLVQSLYAKKSRNAILLTYLIILCFFVVWGVGEYLSNMATRPAPIAYITVPSTYMTSPKPVAPSVPPPPPSTPIWQQWLMTALEWLRAGNVISMA